MKAGDRVLYVAERGAEPQPATVAARHGTSVWVALLIDDGSRVDQVFAASNHFQSPCGNYCVLAESMAPTV